MRCSEASGHSGHQEHPQPLLCSFLLTLCLLQDPSFQPLGKSTGKLASGLLPFNYLFCLLVFNILSDSIIYCSKWDSC